MSFRNRDRVTNFSVRRTISAQQVSTDSVEISTTPSRGNSRLWVRNDNPDVLIFTDDEGTETVVSGGASSIATLSDVTLAGLGDGDLLSYDLGTTKWINVPAGATPTLASVLTSGNDATGLDVTNVGQLTFDTAGPRGIAIGTDLGPATSNDSTQIAIGYNAYAGGVGNTFGIAIGDSATSQVGTNASITIGAGFSLGSFDVTIGGALTSHADECVTIGFFSTTAATRGIAIGSYATSNTANSIAIGHTVTATGKDSIVFGRNSSSTGDYNICIGSGAVSSATGSNYCNVVVGTTSTISGAGVYYSTILGSQSAITVSYGISIGTSNSVSGFQSVCIGSNNTVYGAQSICIGSGTTVGHGGSICLGASSNSTAANQLSIALGSGNTLRTEFILDGGTGAHNTDTDRLAVEVNGVQYWVKLFQ